MSDSETRRRQPPEATQFKPGVCPNPRGRGAASNREKMQMLTEELYAIVPYQENGKAKRTTKIELFLKKLIVKAMKCDVSAASDLLKWRQRSLPAPGGHTVTFTGFMNDYFDEPGLPGSALRKDDGSDILPDPFEND
jgi:hypothetical protein